MSLFTSGVFTLHSGTESNFKINCDALTDADWAAVAAWVAPTLEPFGDAIGVPAGGHAFARALRPYVTDGPPLLVDDVLTTGASMEQYRTSEDMRGLVLFARGAVPPWVRAVFAAEKGGGSVSGWRELIPPEYAEKLGEIDNWLLTVDEPQAAMESVRCPHESTWGGCKRCMTNAIFLAQINKVGRLIGLSDADADKLAISALGSVGR